MPRKNLPKPMAGLSARRVPRKEIESKKAAVVVFEKHNITLGQEQIGSLERAISNYFWDRHKLEELPTMSECKNALKALISAAHKFQYALETLDKRTWDLILKSYAVDLNNVKDQNDRLGWDAKDADAQVAAKWRFAAYATLLTVRERQDQKKRNFALGGLLFQLISIYESATEKKAGLSRPPTGGAPGGPFFRLSREIMQCLEIQISDEGLAKAIRSSTRQVRASQT